MPTAFNIFAMPLLARAIRATSVNTKDLPGGYEFSPRELFKSGEQGAWYDPSDFSTLYQDAAGTTPVMAVGQPVGKILDKSGRGNHATQTTAGNRPVLRQDSGGRYYLEFDGATSNRYLEVASSQALFKFLHDNTGATVHIGYAPSGTAIYHPLVCTSNLASASSIGFTISQDDRSTGIISNLMCNGGAAIFVNQQVASGVSSAKRVVSVINQPASHVVRRNATQIGSSATEAGSASTANSTYSLRIGMAPTGISPMSGRIYGLIVRGASSNAGQIAAAEAWMNGKTGAY